MASDEPKLLWNPENVRDVAESVGISNIGEEALRTLTQDTEYRLGQVTVEALRFMRACGRTALTVNDVSMALKVLDVEPLYGYDSTRPLRYGEASLGPGQPLYYIEDEEVDFEKLINAPLPKVPRDIMFTAHWLAIEGVQPAIPQNPVFSESRSHELVPKGTGANPALSALAGNDGAPLKPSVKHVISKEMVLYFDKIQAAVLDETPDEEVERLRQAALASVRDDPGLHQLVPYFVNYIANQVTHRLDDLFVLRQMMELTSALISNTSLFLDPYASPISSPVLTCLMARKLGADDSPESTRTQYQLREFAASLVGKLAARYATSNHLLRPKLTRTCLKYFLDPSKPVPVLYGAILGLAAAGGPESIRILVVKTLKDFDAAVLMPLKEKGAERSLDYEMLLGAIVQAVSSISGSEISVESNGVNGTGSEGVDMVEFLGKNIGERILQIGNHRLNKLVLDARYIE
ncbi:Transcription initiation factor TFIID subunit 6 [Ceratocystis lukuohia]|uniref:Transcription initiation factor TFIID subunit 6 n=3 Tax=Ceratocystis TaxID=5157 RepID=A0A0F8BYI4_CERFI|nr:Transcription initiation factor TFIID subunit 6 [Ceratocystis platani]PHH50645.1 Transcription initiation factor TFIID subunit 6 [Ceratocystis fimbriata CBS 114723]